MFYSLPQPPWNALLPDLNLTGLQYIANRDKFYAEAEKKYWKTIAELIPNEVPTIEQRG